MEDITKAELITVEAIEAETAYTKIKSATNVSETEKESKKNFAASAAKKAAEAANKVAEAVKEITKAVNTDTLTNATTIALEEARTALIIIS